MLRYLLCVAALSGCAAGEPLENLVALTRLLGYVRYFHPTDQAASADWEAVAADAIPAVEAARTPQELARVLGERFALPAPTVQVFPTGSRPRFVAPERRPLKKPGPPERAGDGGQAAFWICTS
jgi:hypothetical protein